MLTNIKMLVIQIFYFEFILLTNALLIIQFRISKYANKKHD